MILVAMRAARHYLWDHAVVEERSMQSLTAIPRADLGFPVASGGFEDVNVDSLESLELVNLYLDSYQSKVRDEQRARLAARPRRGPAPHTALPSSSF